ncbi:hypothetical protein [Ectothiorhodospira mobilis]|uniref:hypothetical protein n=1 Tax=Ectothiorhodospira mobilis TaxID=195064 RepID=UPI001EE97C3F|nr:hypothetical protein [Ectothiorhodospira mobilis]MCG5534457.1 hypothetical protein [Ectothiorhodospira mobilis]
MPTAGYLLGLAMVFGTWNAFGDIPRWPAAAFAWGAGLLLWPTAGTLARRQALMLAGGGVLGLIIAWAQGATLDWGRIFGANVPLLIMLAGVSFLRLAIPMDAGESARQNATGPRALRGTVLSTHLFGAVINLSAVFITGDHMQRNGRLTRRQATVITRSFSSASFWSPFFAAMATVLIYAPGSSPTRLMAIGLPLAVIALLVTLLDRNTHDDAGFVGYPIRLGTLWLPGLLALAVLSLHQWHPEWSVLAMIAVLGPAAAVIRLSGQPQRLVPVMHHHVGHKLPRMVNELWLFLSAGVLAGGLSSVLTVLGNDWLPFTSFGGVEAAITLALLILASVIGVHPAASIAVLGTVLMPVTDDPNLLGATFLAAWAIGINASPLSGLNLAVAGHYDLRSRNLLFWNAGYTVIMYLAACAVLGLYAVLQAM